MKLTSRLIVVFFTFCSVLSFLVMDRPDLQTARAEPAGAETCFAKYNGAIVNNLQTAIDNAADLATVQVSGTCYGRFSITAKTLSLQGGWNNDFTVQNPTLYPTILDAGGDFSGPILTIANYGGSLTDLIIQNGDHNGIGGGLHNAANLTIIRTKFTSNYADYGGAIYNTGFLNISDSVFTFNSGFDGPAIHNTGTFAYLTISGSTFHGNTGSFGGGLYNADTVLLVSISNSTFSSNSVEEGGGIYFKNSYSPNISNTKFINNSAERGGAIYNFGQGTVFVDGGSEIRGNYVDFEGGGIFNEGQAVQLTNTDVSENIAIGEGGGIFSTSGYITATQTTISGNGSGSYGGGVYLVDGHLSMNKNTLAGNTASVWGGGLAISVGSMEINASTLSGNRSGLGGGVYNEEGVITINNSTLSGNSANQGGGVYNGIDGDTSLLFTTLSDNKGGGVYNDGTFNLRGTLIANSSGTDGDCRSNGGSFFGAYSLVEDSGIKACGLTNGANLNIIGQHARLGPLAGNGGPTATHALLNGSPAIEKGDFDNCPDYDQRGVSRPQGPNIGANCDIGAYERAASDQPYRLYLPIIPKDN